MAKRNNREPNRRPVTRRVTTEEQVIQDTDPFAEPGHEAMEEDFDYAALGDDRLIRVEKSISGAWEWCFNTNSTSLDEEQIRHRHGPGLFKIKAYKGRELMHEGFIRLAPVLTTATEPAVVGPSSEIRQFSAIQQMYENQTKFLMQLLENFTRREPAERTPMNELLDAMRFMRENAGGSMGPEKIFEILKQGMDMGRETAGGAREPESIGSQLLSIAKEAMPAIIASQQRGGPPQLAAGNPPQQEQPMNKEFLIKQGIAYLKRKAAGGSDPGDYVVMALDNLEDPLYRSIAEFLAAKTWEEFVQFDPELGSPIYAEFFKSFHDGLRSGLQEENPVAEHPNGVQRDARNPASNARPRKSGTKQPLA